MEIAISRRTPLLGRCSGEGQATVPGRKGFLRGPLASAVQESQERPLGAQAAHVGFFAFYKGSEESDQNEKSRYEKHGGVQNFG